MAGFDDAWAEGIPERDWPERLIGAVRHDPAALATRRAVATTRAWRQAAAEGGTEARARLAALGSALAGVPALPAPQPLREVDFDESVETDPFAPSVAPASPRASEAAPPPREQLGTGRPALASELGPRAPSGLPEPRAEGTRAPHPPSGPRSEGTQLVWDAAILAAQPVAPGSFEGSGSAPLDPDAPPPLPHSPGRVRALASSLRPLAEELVPLPLSRRSRRFWARWREVAGDRGVPRVFVEDLLGRFETAEDFLVELIAEIESVDPSTVHARLQELPRRPSDPDAPPTSSEQAELVGSSVRIEGLVAREDDG